MWPSWSLPKLLVIVHITYTYGQQYDQYDQDICCQDYCYTQDEQPYVLMATKTAYESVFGRRTNQHRIPDCEPIQFWSINRHGTRLPSAKTISRLRQLGKLRDDIVRNYEERRYFPDRGKLCSGDIDLLKRWRWNETITEERANDLTSQGVTDLRYLARRYYSKFENLLREPFNRRTYNFQYADSDRTHDSYQAFIEGWFKNNAFEVQANVFSENRLLNPTENCNYWRREVEDNPDTKNEYIRFKQKQDYRQMVRDVFRRLGFKYTLNDTIIKDMYDMCRYEKAWNLNSYSPWCVVFNKDQLKLLEYAEDLKYYYRYGYGNELNKKVGCPALKDWYEKFERTVNGHHDGHKVSVYFTHSVTLQTLFTAMDVSRDHEPLTADNFYQQSRRQWRTSNIDPFASNLVAVLYECRSGEKYKVMFFQNENPVNYPECSVGLCNWSTLRNKFQNSIESCSLDFCDQNFANMNKSISYLIVLFALLAIRFS